MQKEEWSKERIKAEMIDLKNAAKLSMGIGLPLLMVGGISLFFGFFNLRFGSFFMFGIGIVSILISYFFFLKSWIEKSRDYDKLKAKL